MKKTRYNGSDGERECDRARAIQTDIYTIEIILKRVLVHITYNTNCRRTQRQTRPDRGRLISDFHLCSLFFSRLFLPIFSQYFEFSVDFRHFQKKKKHFESNLSD